MARAWFDYKEYEKWVKNYGIAVNDFQLFLKQFLLEMAQRVVTNAKRNSPVDTGAYKASWSIGSQEISLKKINQYNDKTGHQLVEIDTEKSDIADITVVGDYLQVDIYNPMEYAQVIEYGMPGTKRVPHYVLTIAMNEVEQQLPSRFKKDWENFLKSKGVI